MYIRNTAANTYTVEMNSVEYNAFTEVFDRLIFNPDGVSNQFKITNDKVKVVRNMNGQLFVFNRPKSIY